MGVHCSLLPSSRSLRLGRRPPRWKTADPLQWLRVQRSHSAKITLRWPARFGGRDDGTPGSDELAPTRALPRGCLSRSAALSLQVVAARDVYPGRRDVCACLPSSPPTCVVQKTARRVPCRRRPMPPNPPRKPRVSCQRPWLVTSAFASFSTGGPRRGLHCAETFPPLPGASQNACSAANVQARYRGPSMFVAQGRSGIRMVQCRRPSSPSSSRSRITVRADHDVDVTVERDLARGPMKVS